MAKRFIVFNNKIIKFGSTGIIFDSENSGGGVVADPFRSATVTAVVENGYVNPTITGDTNNDLDHWSVYVAGQSGNKQTFKNSLSVDSIIDYFGLTAPDNSVKTYSMRIQGVTANGTTTSTSSFSIAVTGAVVEIPDADPITILTFGWSNGSGTNPLMSFTPSNSSALTYEIMSSKTGSANTFSLGASTSFNALEALEALGYTINPGSSTTVRFKVRGINANGTSSWSSYSDTVTVARANVITPEVDSWENYNVTLYNEANFLGFNPDHGTSNGRLMSAIVTPSETTTFRTITVFSNISHLDTAVSGASGVYGPRIYRLSSLPGTADGAKDQGDLTGLLADSVLVNSEMEMLCAAEENGELNWTTDFGGKYGKPVTINGQQMYAYEARLSNGNNITLTANNIYLIGLNPNTGGTGRSNDETPADQVNYPLYIPMLSDYTVAEGSNGACGYVNTNNSSTIPTRCGYYNTTQNGGNASIARGLPMFCVNGYVFTNFKGYNIVVTEVDPMEGASITATANTTTVSWTNLRNIETFDHYEYYLTTNASNKKTTTSTSVTIANLKTQFSLNPTTDTTYQLRVYGVSTEGNVTNTASTSFTVTGSGSGEQLTITYNPLNVKSIVDDLGSNNTAAAFIITPSETVTFNMISVYYGGRVTSTSSNNHWHLDMMRISELTSSNVNATKVVDLKTDANGSVYVTGTDVDDIHTNTTGYGWHTQTESNATSSNGIYKSRGVDTNIINPADPEATLIRYTSKLTNGNNITLEAGKTYLIGYQAAVNAGSNAANYATLVVSGMTGNSNNCLVKHSTTSDGTITAKYEAYLPYIEIGDSLDNMIPFTKFSGISSSSGTTETDPMEGRSITATANTTTVSWTNLSSVSTFSNYEYYLATNSANVKTTTSNSVSIETLKTQFSLANDTTYQLRVRAKSTKGNYSNLAAVTFTTPAATSGGGSTDTPTSTVNRLERTFTSTADTAYAKDDGSGWYSFAYNASYGLAVAMHEPNDGSTPAGWPDNPPAAIITLSNTEVFNGTNGVHLAADVDCIAKEESIAGITCDNGYSCLRLCFRDSSGNTSNWIDLHLNEGAIVEGTKNGVGAASGHNSMTIDLDLSSICNKSGFNKSAINAFEVHLAQWSNGTSFKTRQKGLYFNNIVLTNS